MPESFVIDVKRLNKSFNGKPAVIDLSLSVQKGEIFGFLGPNGSGKTTTIRMLCGLMKPDSGTGTCLGYDVITDTLDIKRHVGYMTQGFSLYEDLSIRENLDFMARLYEMNDRNERVQQSLKTLGLMERSDQLAGTLSGGWKQRLALSVALIHQPQLLLLDEPTAGVDPKARRDFWDEIHRLSHEGITTLVSTHYMDEAERCTRLAYFSNGHILATGTSQEIISASHLKTWEVTGNHLIELANELRKVPEITQVVAFGNALHISGVDENQIEQLIEPYKKPPYHWRMIASNLEDVFIALVGNREEPVDET